MATAHATAMKTLLEKRRNRVPACVACHVTGYGTSLGYQLQRPLPTLEHVGCESCHGPGSAHVGQPIASNIQRRVALEICRGCHTPEHSALDEAPKRYWSRIRHK
ncbi:MAG: hypothetical protein KJ052_15330 [Candidatus Hydrogenedentes bacterium]|nr:hypothetical protein [Candidatus Hydrogenedentota bacterium]